MRKIILIMISTITISLLSGCATVFSGYQADLEVRNLPDSLKVYTTEGLELPLSYTHTEYKTERASSNGLYYAVIDSSYRTIQLRSNRDYVLIFKSKHSDYRYAAYAKLNGWWFTLDMICGVIPAVIDAMTENWNYYDPIIFNK
jgi:hypothetical protein